MAAQALRVAANFIAEYYTVLADAPEQLARFYAADAAVQHGTCHALGDCVAQLQQSANAMRRVEIDSLQAHYTTDTTQPHIELAVNGVFLAAPSTSGSEGKGFVQVMVLRPLAADAYAVVRDTLTSDLLSGGHAPADADQAATTTTETSEDRHPHADVAAPAAEGAGDGTAPEVVAPVASMGETYATKTNEEMPSKAAAEGGDDSHAGKQPSSYAECVKKSKVTAAPRTAVRRVTDSAVAGTKATKNTAKRATTATSGTRAGHPARTLGGVDKTGASGSRVGKGESKVASGATTRPAGTTSTKTTATKATRPVRSVAKTADKNTPTKPARLVVKHTKSATASADLAKGGKTTAK